VCHLHAVESGEHLSRSLFIGLSSLVGRGNKREEKRREQEEEEALIGRRFSWGEKLDRLSRLDRDDQVR
jgi:hypothetical protein